MTGPLGSLTARRTPTPHDYKSRFGSAAPRFAWQEHNHTATRAVTYLKACVGPGYTPSHLQGLRLALDLPWEAVWYAVAAVEGRIPTHLVDRFLTDIGEFRSGLPATDTALFDDDGWTVALDLWRSAADALRQDTHFPQQPQTPDGERATSLLAAFDIVLLERDVRCPAPLSHPLFEALSALCERDPQNRRPTAQQLFAAADASDPDFCPRLLQRHPSHVGLVRTMLRHPACPLSVVQHAFATFPAATLNEHDLLARLAARPDIRSDSTALQYLRAAAHPDAIGALSAVQLRVVLAQCDAPSHRVAHLVAAIHAMETVEPLPRTATDIRSDTCAAAIFTVMGAMDVSAIAPQSWEPLLNVSSPVFRELAMHRMAMSGESHAVSDRREPVGPAVPSVRRFRS